MRAVDLHVHLPLPEWVDGGLGPYRELPQRYLRRQITLRSAADAVRRVTRDNAARLLGLEVREP